MGEFPVLVLEGGEGGIGWCVCAHACKSAHACCHSLLGVQHGIQLQIEKSQKCRKDLQPDSVR